MIGGKDLGAQVLMQRIEPPAGPADPVGQRRTFQVNAMARKDLRLPVQRRVVAILRRAPDYAAMSTPCRLIELE